ncbi:hypothetical protein KGV52_01500, partial [Candidatus Gracilibacteria bacterium]|nr:hypothetical protein [Candidatus Gracilibacteria bacterium]
DSPSYEQMNELLDKNDLKFHIETEKFDIQLLITHFYVREENGEIIDANINGDVLYNLKK